MSKLENTNCGIILLNKKIRTNIETKEEVQKIDKLLPEHKRGILTSVEEVTEVIMARQNKISSGDDNMPITILKKLSFANLLQITIIFNQLLAAALFPEAWKHAIGRPIPKPGKDSSYIGN